MTQLDAQAPDEPIFTVELLPARHGDAIWIEYGDPVAPGRLLIDGGATKATKETIQRLLGERITDDGGPDFELIVLTHIDGDHLAGLVRLFEDSSVPLRPADVWYNGWDHLPDDRLGAKQAERLSQAIRTRKLPWNQAFGGDAVRLPGTLADPHPDTLPQIMLPGGMVLTLLSPTYEALAELKPEWKKEVEHAGLIPGTTQKAEEQADRLGEPVLDLDPTRLAQERFQPDGSEANGASIAFLAEYDGRSVLLTGDAHSPTLETSISTLLTTRNQTRLDVDAFKLPHHGSRYNLSPRLVELVNTKRYLISTDGTSRSRHPDPVALSRIITKRSGASLEFNYESATTTPWNAGHLKRRFEYDTAYPTAADEWLTVAL
jgi:beta-lactamase superfamily II metal-dependent hydrolase